MAGYPGQGVIQSVNGKSEQNIVLSNVDVGADPLTGNEPRSVFLAEAGSDANNGYTNPQAVRTEARAMEQAALLMPDISNLVALVAVGGGSFDGPLEVIDYVQVKATGVSFSNLDGTVQNVVSVGNSSQSSFGTSISTHPAGNAIYVSDKARVGIVFDAAIARNSGGGQSGLRITGQSSDVFFRGGQILIGDGYCIHHDATTDSPVKGWCQSLNIGLSGGGGLKLDSSSSMMIADFQEIRKDMPTIPLTLTHAVNIQSGSHIVHCDYVEVDTLCIMAAGTKLNFDGNIAKCNIDVPAGAELQVNILDFDHTSFVVSNAGIINGRIGEILYGSWVDGDQIGYSESNPATLIVTDDNFCGSFPINIDTDSFNDNEIICRYTQETNTFREVEFDVVDSSDWSVVYFRRSNTETVASNGHMFTIDTSSGSTDEITPLPSSGNVMLVVLARRITGGLTSNAGFSAVLTRV